MAIQQSPNTGLRELALFAGAGGGILGGHLLGWRTVCAVEFEPYAASVLAARQNDGILPPFPIWDDVRTFDGRPWKGLVDVVSGGFPCQDISAAGKGAGIDGERSGLWGEMARIIREVQPRYVFVENSPMLTSRGLGRVLGDLAEMGYGDKWGCISAADLGAHHERERIWIVANACGEGLPIARQEPSRENGRQTRREPASISSKQKLIHADADTTGNERRQQLKSCNPETGRASYPCWPAEPDVVRVVHGIPARLDRIKALGNAQVPRVAAAAFALLSED